MLRRPTVAGREGVDVLQVQNHRIRQRQHPLIRCERHAGREKIGRRQRELRADDLTRSGRLRCGGQCAADLPEELALRRNARLRDDNPDLVTDGATECDLSIPNAGEIRNCVAPCDMPVATRVESGPERIKHKVIGTHEETGLRLGGVCRRPRSGCGNGYAGLRLQRENPVDVNAGGTAPPDAAASSAAGVATKKSINPA